MSENGQASRDWRRSTTCHGGTCVEVRFTDDTVQVRSSRDPDGRSLHFTADEWNAFLARARRSEFDSP